MAFYVCLFFMYMYLKYQEKLGTEKQFLQLIFQMKICIDIVKLPTSNVSDLSLLWGIIK